MALLGMSLDNEAGFADALALLDNGFVAFIIWGVLGARLPFCRRSETFVHGYGLWGNARVWSDLCESLNGFGCRADGARGVWVW